jgi:predicted ATPase/DNA-binding SARP family transcriptional activator
MYNYSELIMTTLSLRLLGAFQVQRNGQTLNGFATNKVRALLAFLAVECDRPHHRESLSALLWPDQSDERARQSLRQALSNLKQVLGGDDFLLISPQDIQIHPQASVWTDIGETEKLAHACEQHRHRSLESCLPCLQRQQSLLPLYKGDFLAGFPYQNSENYEEWVILRRERVHQQAMNAHIALANLNERRGDLPAALQHVREQIHLEPWREEAHRQAMRLYGLSGERSKALAQYQACRQVLQSELAVVPTHETTSLYEAIQNNAIPNPKPIPQLPEPMTSFIGRTREQAEIAERLADPGSRLITIMGMGGMGKSRLAQQVAHSHAGLFGDGIFFVPLAAASDVSSAIATSLGYTAPDAATQLPDLLHDKELLLVLDNFEHLVETSDVLSELLTAAPGLQIIVTSRERLRLREEWVYTLDGLPFPGERDKADSRTWDSLTLFESRATQIDSHFSLTEACLTDVVAICRLVEGHPLAIELAASAVSERSPAEVAGALRQTFDALAPTLRNFPARHRSLRVVFEHSWNLLTPEERIRLAKLSVFAGGFSAEAALPVTGTSMQQLAGLAAKSLLRRDTDGRYTLHESIRQFAAEKLEKDELAHACHAQYYADLISSYAGTTSAAVLDIFQKEDANLRAAFNWSLLENVALTETLLVGLSLLYSLRGPLSEGEALFHKALQGLSSDDSKKELAARISIELARIYNSQTRYEDSIVLARSATAEPRVQARAFLTWGQALDAQGECETARTVLERTLALAREQGDKRIEADCLRELGNAANRLVEYEVAVPLYAQSLALSHELGDRRGESATLNNWGAVEWDTGDLAAAERHYLEALALYRELGNLPGEAKALNNLSNVTADQGDLGASLHYSEQALRIHREMGNPRGQSAALNNLGATYFSLGQYDAARKSYQQALAFHREAGNNQAEAETLANLSLLDCVQGRLDSGRENAGKAIVLAEKARDKVNHANALYYLGRIELAAGNYAAAETALRHALDLRGEIPHPGRLAEIQTELALLAHRRGENPLSLELLSPVVGLLCDSSALDGTDDPFRIYDQVALILAANGDTRAESIREMGKTLVKQRAARIDDPRLRQSFHAAHEPPADTGSRRSSKILAQSIG